MGFAWGHFLWFGHASKAGLIPGPIRVASVGKQISLFDFYRVVSQFMS